MRRFRVILLAFAIAVSAAAVTLFFAFAVPTPAADPATDGKADKTSVGASDGQRLSNAPDEPAAVEAPEPADNSYCLVCHLNFETEKLTESHQIVGVGCEKCHGESVKHSGDEDGLTPPDVMFDKSDVDKYCMTCHPEDELKKIEYHADVFDPRAEDHLICTKCHGEKHRLKVRTRIWDKKTGELISDDGVRMMYKDSPATEGVQSTRKMP